MYAVSSGGWILSKITLDNFFESVRPCKYDMCVIVKALAESMIRGAQIMLDTEHIWYDAYNGKVYISKRNNRLPDENYREEFAYFISLLYGICRHAGDGTDVFIQKLYVLLKKEEYGACIEITAQYILSYRGMDNKNIIVYILCAVTVIVYEVIYLTALNIKFY